MNEKEVIKRLKEQLLYCIRDHGRVTKYDKGYCIKYIMDFIFYDSADSEKEMIKKATKFYEENIIKRLDIPSEKFEDLTYIVFDDCVVVKSQGNEILSVLKKNIPEFIEELKKVGDAI